LRILLIEDEKKVASYIKRGLEEENHPYCPGQRLHFKGIEDEI
jgi:hypothetical protein